MTTKLKIRAYAIFQFIAFAAIISLLITGGLIANQIVTAPGDHLLKNGTAWSQNIKDVLLFSSDDLGILASVLAYVSIGLFIGSWISGWMLFKVPNRNLFDSLFLIFLCLPIISNIFALFAQVATREITFMSSKVDKEKIIAEQTRILILDKKKEKAKQKALLAKRKEEATQKIELKEKETKKVVTKKTAVKKTPVKKSVAKKPTVKKNPIKKTEGKKGAIKKVPIIRNNKKK